MRERVMNESQLKNKDTAEEIAELRKLSGMKRREFCEYLAYLREQGVPSPLLCW